jgi:hypothetical protein
MMHACRPDDKAKTSVARTRSGIPHVHAKATATAAGVYDLKHAKLRESGTESHKFYLKLPQNVLVTLKTETPYAQMPTAWERSGHMPFRVPDTLCAAYSQILRAELFVEHLSSLDLQSVGCLAVIRATTNGDNKPYCDSQYALSFHQNLLLHMQG